MAKLTWQEKRELNRCFGFLLLIALLFGLLFLFAGCSLVREPARYVPGQQYGDGGATPCMNGSCPVVNQPKQWLKPCR